MDSSEFKLEDLETVISMPVVDSHKGEKYYDNCKIMLPDGKFGGYASRRKINWYLKKGIADKIDDNAIKLNFTPVMTSDKNGQIKLDDNGGRENICVVCGEADKLFRYSLMPMAFKKYYPLDMKKHRSDLIVLLCYECKEDAQYFSNYYSNVILSENGFDRKDIDDKNLIRVRKVARLMIEGKKLRDHDATLIEEYIGHKPSDDELKELSKIDIHKKVGDYRNIYESIVMEANKSDNGILEFENRFLKYFAENMEPEFIPKDIEHRFISSDDTSNDDKSSCNDL